MTAVDEYIADHPVHRAALQHTVDIVRSIAPDAEETIYYGMPSFKVQGKGLFGFLVWKHHIGLYPYTGKALDAFADQLTDYSCTKGAIQVPFDKPLPDALLKAIIKTRLRAIDPSL